MIVAERLLNKQTPTNFVQYAANEEPFRCAWIDRFSNRNRTSLRSATPRERTRESLRYGSKHSIRGALEILEIVDMRSSRQKAGCEGVGSSEQGI